VRVAFALFDGLPEGGDDAESFLATLGVCGLDKPAADDHSCAPDATAAVDSAYAATSLVVSEDVKDGEHELLGLWEGAVLDWELVVFDVGEGYAVSVCEVGEVRGIG